MGVCMCVHSRKCSTINEYSRSMKWNRKSNNKYEVNVCVIKSKCLAKLFDYKKPCSYSSNCDTLAVSLACILWCNTNSIQIDKQKTLMLQMRKSNIFLWFFGIVNWICYTFIMHNFSLHFNFEWLFSIMWLKAVEFLNGPVNWYLKIRCSFCLSYIEIWKRNSLYLVIWIPKFDFNFAPSALAKKFPHVFSALCIQTWISNVNLYKACKIPNLQISEIHSDFKLHLDVSAA